MGEDNTRDTKTNAPKRIKTNSNSVVILRHRGTSNDIKELEEKYSEKFGCKVIILESNIDYVDKIDG